ncbi:uncharacterized protein LOC118755914 [Rhagoletis pomonella]|uniref:uncharacterized protein LOC118755914 n=1 Tax=Rhagoletis pomonella TaxID=28610 RepID=UPI0017846D2A|nr:uncharacterized protein LOC118755914 [Rhagoletis pomonella]
MKKFWLKKRNLNKFIISAIIHSKDDIRPFTNIEIFGHKHLALLDSGANKSVIGGALAAEIVSKPLKFNKINGIVHAADGHKQTVAGTVSIPLTYNSIEAEFEFLVVPSIKQSVICGMDFWRAFGISIRTPFSINEVVEETASVPSKLHMSDAQRAKLQSVIEFFPSSERYGLGETSLVEHVIDTAEAKPIKQRFYPLSPAKEKLLCEEVDRMLRLGVIEEASASPWSSLVTLVVKPGKVRLCLDARKVNAVTVKDAYPMPILEGLLSRLPPVHCIYIKD